MMRTLRSAWNRLLGSLGLRNRDLELAEELEAHIQLMAEEEVRKGVAPQEAVRRARLQFGSLEAAKEDYRDRRGLPLLDALGLDLRYALRGIRKNPGFSTVAILSLAIGIGANTAIYSMVDGVLLRPLPFFEPARLYAVREMVPQLSKVSIPVNPLHTREWGKQCGSIEQVALIGARRVQSNAGGEPESILGAMVPSNLFPLFGVAPMTGRSFVKEEEEPGRDRVVMLAETFWRTRFGADPKVVGKTIVLNGRNYGVVGVVPAWFRLPISMMEPSAMSVTFEVYFPLALPPAEFRAMGNFNYSSVVRLRRGASVERALAEINAVQAQFPPQAGENIELSATLIPIHELVAGRARMGLWMLAGSVGAILLIVCINLANLLLSRIASRTREAAIRTALGASRGRQFRLVMTESLLLALVGGGLGVVFANWLLKLLASATTIDIPRIEEVGLNPGVLLFAFGLTVATGLLFGALPAWRITRSDPQDALRAGSHTMTTGLGGLRLRQGLIGLEVGLSAALLLVAGLLAGSLLRLLQVDKGFEVRHVMTTDLRLQGSMYAEPAVRERLFDRVLKRVGGIPGVEAAGLVTALPTRGETWLDPISLEDDTRKGAQRPVVNNRYASPNYFRAMNIPIKVGRAFEESDRQQRVGVLSEKAAKLLWPDVENPVGRRYMGEDDKPLTLVGISAEVRASLYKEAPATAYYPYWQRVPDSSHLIVRTSGNPAAMTGALRAALRSEAPQMPVREVRTMEEVVNLSVAERRFQLMLVIVFAASALLVASLGIYGVVSYSVACRRNEIGIRMALGAQRSQLLGLVMKQGMTPVVLGLAAGIGAALLLGQAIRGLLFGVQPTDPLTMGAVAAVLLTAGVLACLIPAGRAVNRDAVSALRFE